MSHLLYMHCRFALPTPVYEPQCSLLKYNYICLWMFQGHLLVGPHALVFIAFAHSHHFLAHFIKLHYHPPTSLEEAQEDPGYHRHRLPCCISKIAENASSVNSKRLL